MDKEENLRFGDFVDDVVSWSELLRKDKRFNQLILLGHSEGSLMVTLAAPRVKPDALITLCGMGRTYPAILRDQLGRNLPEDLKKKAFTLLNQLESGKELGEVPDSLKALFRPSVVPFLRSAAKHDPASLLGKLELQILIVSGTTDIQTTQSDYDALIEAAPQATKTRIAGMNHVLKAIDSTNQLEQLLRTYLTPRPPLTS